MSPPGRPKGESLTAQPEGSPVSLLDRCPACRARLGAEAQTCPRCGCELALVRQVERHAQAALERGLLAWGEGDVNLALAHVQVAWRLHATPLTAAVLGALMP